MALDFPSNPAIGQLFTSWPLTFVWNGTAWDVLRQEAAPPRTARHRNRFVNPIMQVTQEIPRTTNLTTSGAFAADQWSTLHSTDGTLAFANVANTYLGLDAGPYCLTAIPSVIDANMGADQYAFSYQPIEGVNISDFNWGTASGLPAVLRFKAASTFATTFCVSLRNALATHSFVKECVLPANMPTWFSIPVPPPPTGTWAIDATSGVVVSFTSACGSNRFAPAEGWSAGNFIATPAIGNIMASLGNRLSFGGVGLYLDPDNSGAAPPLEFPNYADDLRACQRYWEILNPGNTALDLQLLLRVDGGAQQAAFWWFKEQKRVAPTMAFGATAGVTLYSAPVNYAHWMNSSGTAFSAVQTAQANARM